MTIDNGTTYTSDDLAFGAQLVGFIIGALCWVAAALTAWTFFSGWACVAMYILLQLIAGLIAMALGYGAALALGEERIAAVGAFASVAWDSITGVFASKAQTA